jgi:hypothetical protein
MIRREGHLCVISHLTKHPDIAAMCAHRHTDAPVRDLTVSSNGHPSDPVIPLHACAHKPEMPPWTGSGRCDTKRAAYGIISAL